MSPGDDSMQEVCQTLVHELHEKNWCIFVGIAIGPQVLYNVGMVDTTQKCTLCFESSKRVSMFFARIWNSYLEEHWIE